MNHDAVLLDAAETLFTTRGSVGEIYQAVAARFGSVATADEIQAAFARQFRHSGPLDVNNEKAWWRDVVHRVFLDVGMVDDFDRFFDEVYDCFRDSRGWRLFPETRRVLALLRTAGLHLGVISNFDSRLYTVLRDLELLDYFDSITISSEAGYAKPHPGIYSAAIRAVGCSAGRIAFAGDSLMDDYQGASQCGLDAYLLDRNRRYVEMRTIRRIDSLEEILAVVGC